ncbi:hypothetical protein, partial [Streptomyces diastaticus]|uniref:hypothetical protein n=1 Tax=Streptomyces diastaticus TaxID=1956 RepID=UPI003659CE19
AKPVVRQAAHTAVNVPFLDTVLYLLGITREEVEAADARVSRPRRPRPGGRLRRAAQRLLALTAGASRRGARRRPRAR